MYTLLLAVIYLAFISLGLPDSLLGSAWPTIRVDFGVPLSYMGFVSMIISGGTIISGLMSERLTKKFGTRGVTLVSVLLTAAALFGFSTAESFWQLCIWGVPYLLIGFLCYCAAEATTMLWASSYLEGVRGVSKTRAAAFGSLFFIGITAGRFIAGFISDKLGDNRMIRSGTGLALFGVVLTALPVGVCSMAGFVIIGLGCAPVYPCIIHSTPANFGAENSQGIIGIQMASAYVGSTFMPPLFGLIANHISLRLMPLYLAFFLIMLLVMISKTEKACAARKAGE